MPETFDFSGRTVMVTGGASGIGLAMVHALAASGAAVAIADVNEKAAKQAASDIIKQGGRAESVTFDVRDVAATNAAVDVVEGRLGPIDGLVTAAGISRPSPAATMEEDLWDLVIGVNLKGTFVSCQAVGRRMIARGRGAIVAIASTSSVGGHPGRVHYCASKAGVVGLVKDLACEWGSYGVRVNAVGPSATDTPMIRDGIPADFVSGVFEDRTPLGRLCRPEEIANVCMFLLSDLSSFMTGSLVMADGGITAGAMTRRQGRDLASKVLLANGVYSE
ncbi:SDR family NAD(P)-dependent oxidoreductase [Bradyrhizobium sp.]|uniref:SDR family NAD(P)-dependent oxidoreductase n=1 Tax=Bradyrhizobium sp. TaxID=376 RepID=UPI0039E48B03